MVLSSSASSAGGRINARMFGLDFIISKASSVKDGATRTSTKVEQISFATSASTSVLIATIEPYADTGSTSRALM